MTDSDHRDIDRYLSNVRMSFGDVAAGRASFPWFVSAQLLPLLPFRKRYFLAGSEVVERQAVEPMAEAAFFTGCSLALSQPPAAEYALDDIAEPWSTWEQARDDPNKEWTLLGTALLNLNRAVEALGESAAIGGLLLGATAALESLVEPNAAVQVISRQVLQGLVCGLRYSEHTSSMLQSWVDGTRGWRRLGAGGLQVQQTTSIKTVEEAYAAAGALFDQWSGSESRTASVGDKAIDEGLEHVTLASVQPTNQSDPGIDRGFSFYIFVGVELANLLPFRDRDSPTDIVAKRQAVERTAEGAFFVACSLGLSQPPAAEFALDHIVKPFFTWEQIRENPAIGTVIGDALLDLDNALAERDAELAVYGDLFRSVADLDDLVESGATVQVITLHTLQGLVCGLQYPKHATVMLKAWVNATRQWDQLDEAGGLRAQLTTSITTLEEAHAVAGAVFREWRARGV